MNKEELLNKKKVDEIFNNIEDNIALFEKEEVTLNLIGFTMSVKEKVEKINTEPEANEYKINYPSFKILLTKEQILSYLHSLFRQQSAILKKYIDVAEFSTTNDKLVLDYINLANNTEETKCVENFINQISEESPVCTMRAIKSKINYICIKIKSGSENYIVIAKGKPFVKSDGVLFSYEGDETAGLTYRTIPNILKMPLSLSAVIVNRRVFLFTNLIECIFGIENSLKEQLKVLKSELKSAAIISDNNFDDFSKYLSAGRRYYKSGSFDIDKLDKLKKGHPAILKTLEKHNILKGEDNKFIISTEEQYKYFYKVLCNDIKCDICDNEKLFDAPTYQAIE